MSLCPRESLSCFYYECIHPGIPHLLHKVTVGALDSLKFVSFLSFLSTSQHSLLSAALLYCMRFPSISINTLKMALSPNILFPYEQPDSRCSNCLFSTYLRPDSTFLSTCIVFLLAKYYYMKTGKAPKEGTWGCCVSSKNFLYNADGLNTPLFCFVQC